MAKKSYTFSLDEDLVEMFDELAESLRLNRSTFMNLLLSMILIASSDNQSTADSLVSELMAQLLKSSSLNS